MATYPAQTSGLGVPTKIVSAGNINPGNTTPGYNGVILSLSGANGPKSFQLTPNLEDAGGNEIVAGTAFTLTAVAASAPGVLTLSAVAANGAYTGTITGGGSNGLAGQTFTVAGFVTNTVNNGTFICTASTTTVLTLANPLTVAETHAATATDNVGTAVYTGTITGGGTNAFAGLTFVVAGFTGANNNGEFLATASSGTTLTLDNGVATAETHAATATSQEITGGNTLTYFSDGTHNATTPGGGTTAQVVSVSATGLLTTNAVEGGSVVEISYPTFNNAEGTTGAPAGNPMHGLPLDKIYAEVNVTVVS